MSSKPWTNPPLARRLSATPVVSVSLLLTAMLSGVFSVWGALVTQDSLGIFRSQLAFSADRFADITGTWNVAEFIRLTASVDFVYPVAYATAIAAVWAKASGPKGWDRSTWPLAAAMTAIAADWLENTAHLVAIKPLITGEPVVAIAVAVGSFFSVIKWAAIVAGMTAAAGAAWQRRSATWRIAAIALAAGAAGIAGLVASLTT